MGAKNALTIGIRTMEPAWKHAQKIMLKEDEYVQIVNSTKVEFIQMKI